MLESLVGRFMGSMKCIALVALQMMLTLPPSAAQDVSPTESFVTGEAIVKFAANSETGTLIARATEKDDAVANSQLKKVVQSLGQEIGLPAELKRIGSGGDIVVSIRRSDLLTELRKRVLANPSVKAANISSKNESLIVQFVSGSPEGRTVNTILKNKAHDHELQLLAKNVIATVPLNARAVSTDTILLTPDPKGLTIDFVRRLQQGHDVQRAQPNFLLGPMSQNPASPDVQ
jgi:hypothetical protein